MSHSNRETSHSLLVRATRYIPSIATLTVIAAAFSINTAKAALVPIARDTQVRINTTHCSLSCYAGGTPGQSEYTDFFTNAEPNPLQNKYENLYQTSFFSPTQIYALTYGSAAEGIYGEFGGETYSSSFSLQFSLSSPHSFELNGLMLAKWGGLSMDNVSVKLTGPLTQEFSISADNSEEFVFSGDVQSPISVSGILPVGIYTFAVATGGSGSTIEFSNLRAEATLDLKPVPTPAALPLFLSALGGLSLFFSTKKGYFGRQFPQKAYEPVFHNGIFISDLRCS